MAERSRLRERALEVMGALLARYETGGSIERAVGVAIRALALDPLQESLHRRLLSLYARQGRQGAALKQYRLCRIVLERELGVAPEPATEALFEEIRQQRSQGTVMGDGSSGRKTAGDVPGSEADSHPDAGPDPVVGPDPGSAPVAGSGAGPVEDAGAATGRRLRQVTLVQMTFQGDGDPAFNPGADPEARHQALEAFHEAAAVSVHAHGGRMMSRFGETLLVAFGIDRAHGNEPEQALRMVGALPEGERGAGLRVAVASGAVLVSGGEDGEVHLTGTPLEEVRALAEEVLAGEVRVTDSVHGALKRRFGFEAVDGAWRVTAWWADSEEEDAGPIVGRERERRQFQAEIETCLALEAGHSFLVRGDAGIGKSRLLAEMIRLAREAGIACGRALVLDFGAGSGPDAVVEVLRSLAGEFGDDALHPGTEEAPAEDGAGGIARACRHIILGQELPEALRGVYQALDADTRRARLLDAMSALIRDWAERRPVLLAVENIH